MIDIVERLRQWSEFGYGVEATATMKEAAAEIERLRAALELIDSVSVHSGGDIHGVHPSQWEAAFKEVQAMTRSALEEGRT